MLTKWAGASTRSAMMLAVLGLFMSYGSNANYAQGEPPEPPEDPAVQPEVPHEPPGALDSIPVPEPPNLSEFIKNRKKAILLGKALFWDMQAGSDGETACATCHWHAGADVRDRNTVNPGVESDIAKAFDAHDQFFQPNDELEADDFPFHRLQDPTEKRSSNNPVVHDTSEIVGSQGVVKQDFVRIREGIRKDKGVIVPDSVFNINGINSRQVTNRNTPTTINAVFFDRLFWDGRANRFFNGVNPFGDTDPFNSMVWKNGDGSRPYPKHPRHPKHGPHFDHNHKSHHRDSSMRQVSILIDNAALASQAVGPPRSNVEMSWNGRTFPELGQKMLTLRPLRKQRIHKRDSVLGKYRDRSGRGLKVSYSQLIRDAFRDEWWNSKETTDEGFTQMEANFSLFWGLAIQMYESTLVSDDAPYDQWKHGDESALSEDAKKGLEIFLNEGKCINCHGGPEFAAATISEIRGALSPDEDPIEFMPMQVGEAFYDNGFYNIGVRPTAEDLGVGATIGPFGPIALARRVQQGQKPHKLGQDISIGPNDRIAVDGAFKTPSLRNVELTGPYFHNGGQRTLTEVVQFYARRADFFEENKDDLDPDVEGIEEIRGDDEKIAQVVAFLKSLTDERVRYKRAPFDHPELVIMNGHKDGVKRGVALDNRVKIRAVGRKGGKEVKPFDEIVD